jgi:hypothetical protein
MWGLCGPFEAQKRASRALTFLPRCIFRDGLEFFGPNYIIIETSAHLSMLHITTLLHHICLDCSFVGAFSWA